MSRRKWNARETLSARAAQRLEADLLAEFGDPAEVVRQEKARLHQQAQDALTGMPEEQADWEADEQAANHEPGPLCGPECGHEGEPGPAPHKDEPMRPYPACKLEWLDDEDDWPAYH